MHHFWSSIGFSAETVIFFITGIILGQRTQETETISGDDYIKLLGIFVTLNILRLCMILMFYPILSRIGYGMNFRQVILCAWAGLRGAVGLSLALMVTTSTKIPRTI